MTPIFTKDQTIESLLAESNSGNLRVCYKVFGYWSRDTITVYVRRGFYGDVSWQVSISQSSGGRDTKEVERDSDAIRNYANAMIDAADFSDLIMQNAGKLEEQYQVYVEQMRIREEEEQRKKQAMIDSDPAMGTLGAEKAVLEVIHYLKKNQGGEKTIRVKQRGQQYFKNFNIKLWEKASFSAPGPYGNTVRVKKQDFIAKLAEQSATYEII
jgi:hypothetical protein